MLGRPALIVPAWLACVVLLLLAPIRLGLAAPGAGQAGRPPNLVVLFVDTLRADHLHCYGYPRQTTPNLDSLARTGTVFRNAVSQASFSLPAYATIFTSLFPLNHGMLEVSQPLSRKLHTLAEHLAASGYRTAAFVGDGQLAPNFGLGRGFQTFRSVASFTSLYWSVPAAVEWLDSLDGEPFFLFLHGYDPHLPYSPPLGFSEMHDPDYEGVAHEPGFLRYDVLDRVCDMSFDPGRVASFDASILQQPGVSWRWRRLLPPFAPGLNGPVANTACTSLPPENLSRDTSFEPLHLPFRSPVFPVKLRADDTRHIVAHYDGAVSYADLWCGVFLESLRARGALDNTVVVVAGDHGESLGEHGFFGHGLELSESIVHVPLIVSGRGVPAGRSVSDVVGLVDLAPTLLQLARAPPCGAHQGRSLLPLLAPAQPPPDPDSAALSFKENEASIRTQRWLLNRNNRREKKVRLEQVELFDVTVDPACGVDVAASHPEVVQELKARLMRGLESRKPAPCATLHQPGARGLAVQAASALVARVRRWPLTLALELGSRLGMPRVPSLLERSVLLSAVSWRPFEAAFRLFDRDGDGLLAFEEWSRLVLDPSNLFLDLDGDATVTPQEFRLSLLETNQSREYIEAVISKLRLAALTHEQGDSAGSAEQYAELCAAEPELTAAHLGLGRCRQALEAFQRAEASFRQAARTNPAAAEAWLGLALLQAQKGDEQALSHLSKGLALLELTGRLRLPGACGSAERSYRTTLAGTVASQLRKLECSALADLAESCARRLAGQPIREPLPQPFWRLPTTVDLLLRRGLPADARALVEATPNLVPWVGNLLDAIIFASQRNPHEAGRCLALARERGAPPMPLVTLELGNQLDLGDRRAADRTLDWLGSIRTTPWEMAEIGWQLAYRAEWKTASEWFVRAMRQRHDLTRNSLLTALCELELDEPERAMRYVERFTKTSVPDSELLHLQVALLVKLGMLRMAITVGQQMVFVKPDDLSNRLLLASIYGMAGDQLQRRETLLQARQICPAGSPLREPVEQALAELGPPPAAPPIGKRAESPGPGDRGGATVGDRRSPEP